MLLRSGDPTFVITATMFLDISPSTVRELLGKRKICGSHSFTDEQVTYGHVCSSLSMRVIVVTPSIVLLESNGSIKSWSSVATKIGDYAKGPSWNVILFAHGWLGFTRVCYMVSPIQIYSLRIRILVSPVSGFLYAVAA